MQTLLEATAELEKRNMPLIGTLTCFEDIIVYITQVSDEKGKSESEKRKKGKLRMFQKFWKNIYGSYDMLYMLCICCVS